MVKRIGNWYEVRLEGHNQTFQVLIQKHRDSVVCSPDSMVIFNEDMTENFDNDVYDKIYKLMEEKDYTFEEYD